MATANSTARPSRRKRAQKFPLYLHKATGQWSKRVAGRLIYFGKDKDAALARWEFEKDELLKGRNPRQRAVIEGLTVRDGVNLFLTDQEHRKDDGEISQRYFDELHAACETVVDTFGRQQLIEDLKPGDFAPLRRQLAKQHKYNRLKNTIVSIRRIFKWLYENDHITAPVKYGTQFSVPNRKQQRKEREQTGQRLFTPDEIKTLLESASPTIRAIILLGINTGIGNKDVSFLTTDSVDLDAGFLDSRRLKTYVSRRAALWPETIQAICDSLKTRPTARLKCHRDLLFITKYRGPWGHVDKADSAVTKEFRKLLDKTRIYRRGLSYYTLRHTYRTIADETKDWPAIDLTMGHARDGIDEHYRQKIRDTRLEDVAAHVHAWLFGVEVGAK